MNVLDLFSGIGAFSLASQHVGFNVIAHSEINKHCQTLLADKFPNVQQLGDICNVKKSDFREPIDLIAGGSPCQDLSIAGRGEGLAGTQSRLWFEYLRLATELKPQWLVWENVPNALHANGGADFLAILRGLDECGYSIAWRVLNAEYFGVPQRRRRIFLVASLGNGRAAEVLFERESLPGTLRTRPEKWQAPAVAGTITSSASGTARTGGNANQVDLLVFGRQHSHTFTENPQVASTLAARDYKDFGDLVGFSPASYKRDVESNYLSSRGVASTLRARNNRGQSDTDEHFIVNGMIRRLTPLECERLMGFPDFWTNGFSDTFRYHGLGNSIAVPVAKWVFEQIAAVQS